MNVCQMDRESHLQDDVRNVQILQRMQCTNECNEHDAHDAKTKWCTTRKRSKTIAKIAMHEEQQQTYRLFYGFEIVAAI